MTILCFWYTVHVNIVLNPLNAELNPICHLLALLGGATIVDVSRLRANNVVCIATSYGLDGAGIKSPSG
jgi:hypothetical protein